MSVIRSASATLRGDGSEYRPSLSLSKIVELSFYEGSDIGAIRVKVPNRRKAARCESLATGRLALILRA